MVDTFIPFVVALGLVVGVGLLLRAGDLAQGLVLRLLGLLRAEPEAPGEEAGEPALRNHEAEIQSLFANLREHRGRLRFLELAREFRGRASLRSEIESLVNELSDPMVSGDPEPS